MFRKKQKKVRNGSVQELPQFKTPHIPMESFEWMFEGNLGAKGFELDIINRIQACLESNEINADFDDIKKELGLENIFLDIYEHYVIFQEDIANNISRELADGNLLFHLIEYYQGIMLKVDKFIYKYLQKLSTPDDPSI
jgi:hypothetical protein